MAKLPRAKLDHHKHKKEETLNKSTLNTLTETTN